jgi:uncharacterized protein (TIGR03067 family)
MRFTLVFVLAFVLFSELCSGGEGGRTGASWNGTWTLISRDHGAGPKQEQGFKLIITDKDMSFRAPNGATKKLGDIARVDPSAKPAQIDLKHNGGTSLGIYELKGDTLKLLLCNPGEERPGELKARPKAMLFTFKRDSK